MRGYGSSVCIEIIHDLAGGLLIVHTDEPSSTSRTTSRVNLARDRVSRAKDVGTLAEKAIIGRKRNATNKIINQHVD